MTHNLPATAGNPGAHPCGARDRSVPPAAVEHAPAGGADRNGNECAVEDCPRDGWVRQFAHFRLTLCSQCFASAVMAFLRSEQTA